MSYSIYPINPQSFNLPIVVNGIGYEDNQPHVFRREGFPMHQVFICKSGKGLLKVKDTAFMIEKGSFFYLEPNTAHEYYGTTDKWEVEWIIFSGNQIDTILADLKFDSDKVGKLNNYDKIEVYYKKIFVCLKSDEVFGQYISSSILYEILIQFYIILHTVNENKTSEGNSIVNKVKQYIDIHYNENLTLETLSEYTNVSSQYLCRVFIKYIKMRPFQYIAMKRIQHAKTLLTSSQIPVNEIAHLVGYNDFSYFCSIFKKLEMISPSEFRGLKLK